MATNTGEYMVPKDASVPEDTGPVMVQSFAQTDVGQTRDHNEDAYLVADLSGGEPMRFERVVERKADHTGTLFMVADGMGGAAAGEIASATAVDVVLRHLREQLSNRESVTPAELVAALARAAEVANWAIFRYAHGSPELRGMGTTATIAALLGDTIYLAQVGDSRAYLIRGREAVQLTKDQSLMQKLIEAGELTEEEAAHSERRNIILQALGPEPIVTLDLTHQRIRRGDVLVLCSDGLSGLVKGDEIAREVNDEPDLAAACDRLIALANDRGGPDNITLVMARFVGSGLELPQPSDAVGHRVYSEEDHTPAAEIPAAPPAPAPPRLEGAGPLPPSPQVPPTRRRQGDLYVRVIAAIGAVVVAALLWRWLSRL
jgi:PPM family protein phosphatase